MIELLEARDADAWSGSGASIRTGAATYMIEHLETREVGE
jgi:hypothetical protein